MQPEKKKRIARGSFFVKICPVLLVVGKKRESRNDTQRIGRGKGKYRERAKQRKAWSSLFLSSVFFVLADTAVIPLSPSSPPPNLFFSRTVT
jgi:hypothetical protein